ncbi:tripartite tricarboxylate transporter permease [Alkalihalobacillus oceani]|uniref:Tripartite tricarboxylate transporter permease n=1 Tax=Halalkalibacter oceani TaxID=1653776 RepID=A0A9X2DR54_9BACI|nr:tripartite tricarboxylate transporter permease [Halalkalibacter oceani]MCM3714190.1 tripartite tricarboxylate transporter permease [Halalkalibacter oceani]
MFEAAFEALFIVLDPSRILFIFLGILVGITVGFLPGLGGPVGMSLLLPFIFGMDPFTGIALLIGMVAVIHTADTFPSVLIGVPGSSGSQATIMDGYPLAQQGQAARALGAAFISSIIGGVIGAIILFLAIPIGRPLVLAFSSPELFMLAILGLSMVGILAGNSIFKGLSAGALGMLLGSVGGAPATAEYRFTFDWIYLFNGIPLTVLALGLFALPEMIDLLVEKRSVSKGQTVGGNRMQGLKDVIKNKWLVFRSAVMGAFIGFIPGLGGSVVDWISYGVAKQTSKNAENFGKGDIRGVIAPESANNAKEGGTLIPTLMFGIPGSGTTAILLGGLIVLGVEAGPSMLTTDLPITLTIVWTLALANIFGAGICFLLARPISKISTIPAEKLVPFLLIIMMIGAYQSTRHWGDFIIFIVIGLIGWCMKHLDWPRAPLLVGFVLSTSAERYLHLSMSRYGFMWLTHPKVIIIGLITILIIVAGFYMKRVSDRQHKGGMTT